MDVILLQDVEKVGLKGDVVGVKRGYARNFLLPRRLAEVATPGRVAELQRIEADRARHEARSAEQAEEIAATLHEDRPRVRGQGRPDRLAVRLGDTRPTSRRSCGARARSASTAARSIWT